MDYKEYQESSKRTLNDLGSEDRNINHMILGLMSEVTELADALNKLISVETTSTEREEARVNAIEELGDLMFYIANFCTIRGYDLNFIGYKSHLFDEKDSLVITISKLSNVVKRNTAYGKEVDTEKEVHYLMELVSIIREHSLILRTDIVEIMNKNVRKLLIRFPQGYTKEKVLNRDLDSELKELKS